MTPGATGGVGDEADDRLHLIGRTLLDRYEVRVEVGRGASSFVYLAEDIRYSRPVALKILRPELAGAVGSKRFLKEIQIAARLQHPHILPLYDSGEVDGLPFYVMPFVEGRSLRDELAARGPLPVEEAAMLASEVGSALAYAHEQGVVHRDVKPENVLLTAGHAVVADFGIARAIAMAVGETLTSGGIAVGTPRYMSPEQFDGSDVDGRSDVYSMGCVVYEMLTGKPPYEGSSAQVLLARHAADQVPDAHVARSEVPRQLSSMISRSMAKPPSDRFSTVTDFVDALRPFALAGSGSHARRRWAYAAAAGVLVVAVILTIFNPWAGPVPNDRKVAIFPLQELDLPAELEGSGYDVALMIGAAMEQTDPLRWVEGAPLLEPAQRASIGSLTAAFLSQVAMSTRSRYFVDGVVRDGEDSVYVTLRLHDALADSSIVSSTASGAIGDEPPYLLALRGLVRLLPPLLEPGAVIDLTPLSNRDPAAIALFIQAERAYRQSRYADALDLYQRALEQDSLFAFGAVRGALAATWENDIVQARALAARAVRHADLLPPPHRLFALGIDAYTRGRADSAAALIRQVLDTLPDWAEAHAALGEVYYHLPPSGGGSGDSVATLEFERASALDGQLGVPFFHLSLMRLWNRDVDSAQILLDAMQRVVGTNPLPPELTYPTSCARNGADSATWASWVAEDSLAALAAAKTLATRYAFPDCAEHGFRAVRAGTRASSFRWAAAVGLQGLYTAGGRYADASALLDSVLAGGQPHAISLTIMDAVAGAPMESEAVVGDQYVRGLFGESYEGMSQPLTLYVFGIWNAYRGDVETARALYERLGMVARSSGAPFDAVLHEALAAHLAYADGDRTAAIRRLRDLRSSSPFTDMTWGIAEALPAERLLLARLLLATGEHAEAERVAAVFDHGQPMMYVAFLKESLSIRLAAAEAVGGEGRAAIYRERLERMAGP